MKNLVEKSAAIREALEDLNNMLADEDHGAAYVKRLTAEMDELHVQLILEANKA